MKRFTTIIIMLVILLSRNLSADVKGVTGELIFHPINLGAQTFTITVTTSKYCWFWDKVATKTVLNSTYYFQRSGLTGSTAFDEPKDINGANLGTIPWGKMSFNIQSTGGINLNFTIDLRDEDWSQNVNKYFTHDTYINIDFQGSGSAFFITRLR